MRDVIPTYRHTYVPVSLAFELRLPRKILKPLGEHQGLQARHERAKLCHYTSFCRLSVDRVSYAMWDLN